MSNCGFKNNVMFCPECDKQLSSKASLCPSCGLVFKSVCLVMAMIQREKIMVYQ